MSVTVTSHGGSKLYLALTDRLSDVIRDPKLMSNGFSSLTSLVHLSFCCSKIGPSYSLMEVSSNLDPHTCKPSRCLAVQRANVARQLETAVAEVAV